MRRGRCSRRCFGARCPRGWARWATLSRSGATASSAGATGRACWHAATRRSSRPSSRTRPTRPTSTPPSPTSPCSPRGADQTQALTLAPTLRGPSPPPPCPASTTRPRTPLPAGTLLARPNPCKMYVSAAPGVVGQNRTSFHRYNLFILSGIRPAPCSVLLHASSLRVRRRVPSCVYGTVFVLGPWLAN